MNFERARAITMERFYALHPERELPAWFAACAAVDGIKKENSVWIVSVVLSPKYVLGENEFWEERNGRRILAKIDPITKEKRIVLSKTGTEPLVVFQVEIANDGNSVYVLIDKDIKSLNEANFGTD